MKSAVMEYVPPPTDRLVTGEELLEHPEWGPCELVRGKVVPVCRPNVIHGMLMSDLSRSLANFVKPRRLGRVLSGDPGVYMERNPDTVKGPDVCYFSAARLPGPLRPRFADTAPNLCAEILSPNDDPDKVAEKVAEWLGIGVSLVWVIDPDTRIAAVHRANGTVRELSPDESLDGEAVLPGFVLPLRELFAALDEV